MDPNQVPLTRSNNDPLGLNKISKNIKKSPLHNPNFAPNHQTPPHQPQVYNVNKSEFRNIVQQLTGSPLREQPVPRPSQNNVPKQPNNRLQRVRPPPLAPTNRPVYPPQVPMHPQTRPLNNVPYPNRMVSPQQPRFDHQLSPNLAFPPTPNDVYSNTNESPVSAYMRYLQNSIMENPGSSQQGQPPSRPQVQARPYYPIQNNFPQPSPRAQPYDHVQNLPPLHPQGQPRFGQGQPQFFPGPMVNAPPIHMPPSPRLSGPAQVINLVSPRTSMPPPLLQSPTSQFLNMPSPRSPYPLLSPTYQNLPPISPSFLFSPIGQSGILGPGPNLPPPLSPGYGFPISPGFFPLSSPIWRGQ